LIEPTPWPAPTSGAGATTRVRSGLPAHRRSRAWTDHPVKPPGPAVSRRATEAVDITLADTDLEAVRRREEWLARARTSLDNATLHSLWKTGDAMSAEDAIAYALVEADRW
jgi:hypothetical protein